MVIDKADHQAIAGANVQLLGTTQGVVTNTDGTYTMSGVTPGDTISISYIDYKTQHIVAGQPDGSFIRMGVTELELESE